MTKPNARRTAAERETRRHRIIAAVEAGFGYDEIARTEGITHERVRQIVVETLRRDDEAARDHRFVQAARLGPALKLTLGKIADGKLEAVDRLIKVLDRLDKYLAGAKVAFGEEDVRQQLIRRLEMAAREPYTPQSQAISDLAPPAPPSQPLEMSQNDQDFPWNGKRFWGR